GRDVFSFYQMPDNPTVIYAGTNNGVYRSNDRGSTWAFTGAAQIKKSEKPERPVKSPARSVRKKRAVVNWSPTQVGRYETVQASKRTSSQKRSVAKRAAKKEKPRIETGLAPGFVELNNEV